MNTYQYQEMSQHPQFHPGLPLVSHQLSNPPPQTLQTHPYIKTNPVDTVVATIVATAIDIDVASTVATDVATAFVVAIPIAVATYIQP